MAAPGVKAAGEVAMSTLRVNIDTDVAFVRSGDELRRTERFLAFPENEEWSLSFSSLIARHAMGLLFGLYINEWW